MRESDLLIREGWMDGVQSGKKRLFLFIKSLVGEKMVIPVCGNKNEQSGFTQKVDFFTNDLKQIKAEILKNTFLLRFR